MCNGPPEKQAPSGVTEQTPNTPPPPPAPAPQADGDPGTDDIVTMRGPRGAQVRFALGSVFHEVLTGGDVELNVRQVDTRAGLVTIRGPRALLDLIFADRAQLVHDAGYEFELRAPLDVGDVVGELQDSWLTAAHESLEEAERTARENLPAPIATRVGDMIAQLAQYVASVHEALPLLVQIEAVIVPPPADEQLSPSHHFHECPGCFCDWSCTDTCCTRELIDVCARCAREGRDL